LPLFYTKINLHKIFQDLTQYKTIKHELNTCNNTKSTEKIVGIASTEILESEQSFSPHHFNFLTNFDGGHTQKHSQAHTETMLSLIKNQFPGHKFFPVQLTVIQLFKAFPSATKNHKSTLPLFFFLISDI
jgi:hypothetical protein